MAVCVCVSWLVMPDSLWPPWTMSSSVHGISPGKNTGAGCHFLLQGIFPTQGSNPGLLHCRQMLYHLSYERNSEASQNEVKCLIMLGLWRTKPTSLSAFAVTHQWLSSVKTYQKKSRQVQLVKLCTVVSRNFTVVSCRRVLDSVVHEELSCISLIHNFGGLIFYGYYFSLALTTFNLTFVYWQWPAWENETKLKYDFHP